MMTFILLMVLTMVAIATAFGWTTRRLTAQIERPPVASKTVSTPHDVPVFLATMIPTKSQRGFAMLFSISLITMLLVLLPFDHIRLAPVIAYLPVADALLCVIGLITCIILIGQYLRVAAWSLLIAACDQLYQAILSFAHAFINSGVLFEVAPLRDVQKGAWLYILWHLGYPMIMLVYAVAQGRPSHPKVGKSPLPTLLRSVAATVIGCGLLVFGVLHWQYELPVIILPDGGHSALFSVILVPLLIGLHVAALLLLWHRGSSVLDLWLKVALGSIIIELISATALVHELYDVGYYSARLFSVLGAASVLGALLLEMNDIYAHLFITGAQQKADSDAQYRAIVDSARDAIIVVNDQGFIRAFNFAAEILFGYAPAEAINQSIALLMAETDFLNPSLMAPAKAAAPSLKRRQKSSGVSHEVRVRHKDGGLIPVELTLATWSSGDETLYTGILRNITERKHIEEELAQSQKMEAIGQLTGGMAHDFNNLLGIIIGNLDLLTERFPDHIPEELADAIAASLNGADLVRHLLAFARRQPLQPRLIEPATVIHDLLPLLHRAVGGRISIIIRNDDIMLPVMADPTQLENTILNLVINARDAMPDGGTLVIECKSQVVDEFSSAAYELPVGHYTTMMITDTGTGIPRDILARITEPFFTTKPSGSGLGLSMVFGYVKQSGGLLRIYSEVGHGTSVRVYLPGVAPDMVPPNAVDHAVEETGEVNLQGTERILVVEDNPEAMLVAQRILQSLGYTIYTVNGAAEAMLALDEQEPFDVLFSDIVMPGPISVMVLAQYVSDHYPAMKIILTSGFSVISYEAINKLGAGYLTKPYRKIVLAKMLRNLLTGK